MKTNLRFALPSLYASFMIFSSLAVSRVYARTIEPGAAGLAAYSPATAIKVERFGQLGQSVSTAEQVVEQQLLLNEIPGVVSDALSITGPAVFQEAASEQTEIVWFFLDGEGSLRTRDRSYSVTEPTIARAPLGWAWGIEVPAGKRLLAIRIRKELNAADRVDRLNYPQHNQAPWVKKFTECQTYGEAIKSAKTTSRTLLPENIVPRMAAGTVETAGPDAVAPHRHPMLEQLFVGLNVNDATVTADSVKADFPPHSLLHIPLGSNHGTQVAAGKKLYYVWLDFFTTKEGQEWLKTHKPTPDKK